MAEYPLTGEGWTWYAVVMTVVIARYVSRWVQLRSLKKFDAEDYVMLVVAMLYTAEIVLLIKSSGTPTNLIPPGQFDPKDIPLRIFGSKLIVGLEMVYCAAIWGCKICLLLFYANLMYSLPVSYTWTKLCASYVVMGYFVMTCLYVGVWCQPFYDYWAVPVQNQQCSTAENHLILNCALNISSDLMIMMIPLPPLIKTRLPLRKKLLLCGLFSLGLFVILSAALNKFYSFKYPYSSGWVYWYTREVSMAVIVASIPHLWALVRKVFRLPTFISNSASARGFSSSSSMRKTPPARLFDSMEDPLSPKSLTRGTTQDTMDIDRILADVERERVPMQPVRFRDLKEGSTLGADLEQGTPTSPDRSYRVPALSPLSPMSSNDMQKLLRSPSPAASGTPSPGAPSPRGSIRSVGSLRPF